MKARSMIRGSNQANKAFLIKEGPDPTTKRRREYQIITPAKSIKSREAISTKSIERRSLDASRSSIQSRTGHRTYTLRNDLISISRPIQSANSQRSKVSESTFVNGGNSGSKTRQVSSRHILRQLSNSNRISEVDVKMAGNLGGTCNFNCKCSLCRDKIDFNTKNYFSGLNDISNEDMKLRKKLLETKMNNKDITDLTYLVKMIKNTYNPHKGGMHILFTNLVFFEAGSPSLMLTRCPIKSKNGKYKYIEEPEKLKFNDIKRLLLDPKPIQKYLEYLGREGDLGKNPGLEKIENFNYLVEDVSKQFLGLLKKTKKPVRTRKKKVRASYNYSKELMAERDKERKLLRKKARERFRVYVKKNTGDEFEVVDMRQFQLIMQLSTNHQYFNEVSYMHQIMRNAQGDVNIIRYRFELGGPHVDLKLFNMALAEPRMLKEELPSASFFYHPPEKEQQFARKLMTNDPEKYCEYTVYKIYHFINLFHKIRLTRFMCEFSENDRGDWELFKALIFDIDTKKETIYPTKNKVTTMVRIEDEVTEKIKELLEQEKKDKEVMEAHKDDEEFDDAVMSQEEQEAYLNKQKQLKRLQGRQKMFEDMKKNFYDQVEKFKEDCVDDSLNIFQTQIKNGDKVYKKLKPEIETALSEIVAAQEYDFEWYKRKFLDPGQVIKVLNPNLDIGKQGNWMKKFEKSMREKKERILKKLGKTQNQNPFILNYNDVYAQSAPGVYLTHEQKRHQRALSNRSRVKQARMPAQDMDRLEDELVDHIVESIQERRVAGMDADEEYASKKESKKLSRRRLRDLYDLFKRTISHKTKPYENHGAGRFNAEISRRIKSRRARSLALNVEIDDGDSTHNHSSNFQHSAHSSAKKTLVGSETDRVDMRDHKRSELSASKNPQRVSSLVKFDKHEEEVRALYNELTDFPRYNSTIKQKKEYNSFLAYIIDSVKHKKRRGQSKSSDLQSSPSEVSGSEQGRSISLRTTYSNFYKKATKNHQNQKDSVPQISNSYRESHGKVSHQGDSSNQNEKSSAVNSITKEKQERTKFKQQKRRNQSLDLSQPKSKYLIDKKLKDINFLERIGLVPKKYVGKKRRMRKVGLNLRKWNWRPQKVESQAFELIEIRESERLQKEKKRNQDSQFWKLRRRRFDHLNKAPNIPNVLKNKIDNTSLDEEGSKRSTRTKMRLVLSDLSSVRFQ